MRNLLTAILLLAASFSLRASSFDILSLPIGDPIASLTGLDEARETVSLNFAFPFAGTAYNTVSVVTNGYLALGDGDAGTCCPSLPGTLLNSPLPLIAPFFSDLDLSINGTIHFRQTADYALFTWNGIGSWFDPYSKYSFRAALRQDGSIYFAYQGIPDILTHLNENLVAGVGPGGGVSDPGSVDLSLGGTFNTPTVYQSFENGLDPFGLDNQTIAFLPRGSGFDVFLIPEPSSFLLIISGIALVVSRRFAGRDRKNGER